MELRQYIQDSAKMLGYIALKEEPEEAITQFALGRDVFVALPTGYGKSLCYGCLPYVFDRLLCKENQSLVVVVSPLVALMKDQVSSWSGKGVSAGYVSNEPGNEDMNQGVLEGRYQLVFLSPEALFFGRRWREMLREEPYCSNLVAFVVDEAHCIKKWGDTFRREFSRLGEIRSILPSTVHVMALTATATVTLRKSVMKTLSMQQGAIVAVSPDKCNIKCSVSPFSTVKESFSLIITKLLEEVQMGRIIIFCRTCDDCTTLYLFFKKHLGSKFLFPQDAPDLSKYRVVDMYTSCTETTVKNQIIKSFTSSSPLRVVIATVAFGMGIDCPDIHQIIHYGAPNDIESYLQATGRAGRDGYPASALLINKKKPPNGRTNGNLC